MWTKKKQHVYVLFCISSLLLVVGCGSNSDSVIDDLRKYEISFDLPGTNSVKALANNQGKLLDNTQMTSSDGNISLSIDKGATFQDGNGKPLQSVKLAFDLVIPVPPENAEIVSRIVEVQPYEAVIMPSLRLTIGYEADLVPSGASEKDLWIYNLVGDKWEIMRYKQMDSHTRRVTTAIASFGKYAVLAAIEPIKTQPPLAQSVLTSITLRQALINGKPTLAEFGRGTCIPCQEMKPILENLAVEFQDRLNVTVVNIDEYRDLTGYYRVLAIPTQICFDSNGKELYRHVGSWPKDQIIATLKKLGML